MSDAPHASVSAERMLRRAFEAYNRQDAEAVLALVSNDVVWATSLEPLHGKGELHAYWRRQWLETNTHDAILEVSELEEDICLVVLDQTVRNSSGAVVSFGRFHYVFEVRRGLIQRLVSIEAAPRTS